MKHAKKFIALMLTVLLVVLTMAVPASAASKVDPSESVGAKIEATFYQLLDKVVSALVKVLNLLIPGLNWGDKWSDFDDYVAPDTFYGGENEFDTEVKEGAQWSAGYAYASLLEGLEIFDGTYYMAGTLEPMEGRVPTKVIDDQGVSVYALSDGTSGIVIQAVVDGYGIARGDVLAIREKLADFAAENNIISINVSALHQHSCIDILGMGAPLVPAILKNPALSLIGGNIEDYVGGKSVRFMNNMYNVVADAVMTAVNSMEAGTLYYGSVDASELIYDKREPITFDGELHRFRFDPDDENANEIWLCEAGIHCVGFGAGADVISADFPYYFKEYVKETTGADVVYVQGAELALTTEYDNIQTEETSDEARVKAYGTELAKKALTIENDVELDPVLNVKFTEVAIDTDNQILTLVVREGLINSVITKDGLGFNIITEVGYMELGNKVGVVFLPGEIAPEIIWGGVVGADKSWTNETWDYAPMSETAKVEKLLCFGLNNDQIGYVLADNDIHSMFTENEEINASSTTSGSALTKAFEQLISTVK
ncbi:MAG: hypothetical protein E7535_04980 [Ruminococcaceae bacterium]|nr:hypothetical protein [Oscillospiraceae bacterium]